MTSLCPIERDEADVLLDYSAGRLSSADAFRLELHFAECSTCRQFVEAQQSMLSAMEDWESIPISADFNRRLYARIAAEEARHGALAKWAAALAARWSPWSWRPALPFALACAALVLALLWRSPDTSVTAGIPEPAAKVERIDIDQVERALDDLDLLNTLSDNQPPPAM